MRAMGARSRLIMFQGVEDVLQFSTFEGALKLCWGFIARAKTSPWKYFAPLEGVIF